MNRRWALCALGAACAAMLAATAVFVPFQPQADPSPATPAAPSLPQQVLAAFGGAEASAQASPEAVGILRDTAALLGVPGPMRSPTDLLRAAHAAPSSPLPIPAVPAGPDPLASALAAYLGAVHAPLPPQPDLRVAIDRLRLTPEGEGALARLVLAYVEALASQQRALSGLSATELEDLAGLRGEAAAMAAAQKVDPVAMLESADLLLRAALEAEPLLRQRRAADAGLPGADLGLLAALLPPPDAATPAPATLRAALDRLAGGEGAPATDGAQALLLPPSLDAALAGLVAAKASAGSEPARLGAARVLAAVQDAEPTLRAWHQLLAPARGGPSAAQQMQSLLSAAGGADPAAVAAAGLGAHATVPASAAPDLAMLLRSAGMPAADAATAASSVPPGVRAALATLLQAEADLSAARQPLASLTAGQKAALLDTDAVARLLPAPRWNATEAGRVLAWAQAASAAEALAPSLRQVQADAAAAVQRAAALAGASQAPLGAPAPADAPVPGLAQPSRAASSTCPVDSPFSDCANDVLLELPVAGGILVTGSGSTRIDGRFAGGDPHVVIDLGGADENLLASGAADAGLGIPDAAVTGTLGLPGAPGSVYLPGSQSPDEAQQNLQDGRTFAVTLDLGGDDRYASGRALVHGSASGIGAVGILWDAAGDDNYTQLADPSTDDQAGQGAGTKGGLGLLVDLAGADAYAAPAATAQGIGTSPIPPFSVAACGLAVCVLGAGPGVQSFMAGMGALLDLGAGADRFQAQGGQGHSAGLGTVGVLADLQGATSYAVSDPDAAFQGGRGRTTAAATVSGVALPALEPGGLALLLDLGGPGDSYTSPPVPEDGNSSILRPPGQPPRKADHAAWADKEHGLALGIDSSLSDQDGDRLPDLAELLGGSDPTDAASVLPDPTAAIGIVARAVASVVPQAKDGDGDLYPDQVEQAWGSDPQDPASTPGLGAGFVSIGSQCPAEAPEECGAGGGCDPKEFACMSLFSLGAPQGETVTRAAVVAIDLGGNDHYQVAAAGPGTRDLRGSLLVDLGGNDEYGGEAARLTQAASLGGAAVLVDLLGDDRYVAASQAQAYAEGPGVAVLLDRDGNDRYQAATQGLALVPDDVAPRDEPSLALLLDGRGADRYTFQTQATVRGPPRDAHAAVIDLLGADRYTSLAPPADLASDGQGPATPHESQGRLERAPGAVGDSRLTVGLFADLGVDEDQYFVTGPDGQLSRSTVKDSAGIVRNAARGPAGPAAGDGGTADALFIDGLHEAGQDGDGDSIPSLLEAALGSDPSDAASVPANAGDQILRLRPSLGLAGSLGDDLRLPGLLVSAQAASLHDEAFPFLVDLGGDDRYVAPGVGGASVLTGHVRDSDGDVRFATTLLLDVGDGVDVYAPEPCVQRREGDDDLVLRGTGGSVPDTQRGTLQTPEGLLVAHCPSLGGAVGGVAVLADAGGRNTFNASIDLGVRTVAGPGRDPHAAVHAWTVTQGAALFHGVGVLAARGTRNEFTASAVASATEAEEASPMPEAQAVTLAQGAAWGHGAGILLSLGQGDDNYTADAAASAPWAGHDAGVAANVAQGAAMAGQGVLVDDGGDNRFAARQGFAQASAFNLPDGFLLPQVGGPATRAPTPGEATQANPAALVGSRNLAQLATPIAVLWSGPGNDVFLAGPASQAAAGMATRNGGLALLVEDGGDDAYRVAATGRPPTGACAGLPPCAFAQAAAESNARAVLLDLAGDDQYDAAGLSHAQSAGNGSALLADLGGNDRYAAGPASQAMEQTVLLDAAGHDAYALGDTGFGIGFFGDGEGRDVYDNQPLGGLDWRQDRSPSPHAEVTGSGGAGLFLDANSFDAVLDAYRVHLAQDTPVRAFAARDPAGADRLAEGGVANGTLYLVAEVASDRADAVQRVGFLLDGRHLGTAQPSGTAGGSARYVLPWDTGQGTDGAYALQATAFLGSSKVPGVAPRPDGLPVPSDEFHVAIDNGPAGQATLSAPAFSPTQPATHPTLTVRPARDLSGMVHLTARLLGAGQDVVLVDGPVPAGVAFDTVLDGVCGAAACPDGGYEVEVTLADGTGSVALPRLPVLVDGTPPTAQLTVPEFSGAGRQAGPGRLEVTWTAQDAGSGLGTATVTAANATGALIAKVSVPAALGRASVPAGDGQKLLLALNITDGLGNAADPCGAVPLGCPDAANTTADFRDPRAGTLALSSTLVGPGRQANATLAPTDDDTWIARAVATVTGGQDQSVELAQDGANWTALIDFAQAPAGETPFLVRADVFDAAGNQAQAPVAAGVLDTLRPRLGAPTVSYESAGGPVGTGRPGTLAVAQLNVTEHALASVRLDAAALGLGDVDCEREAEPALTTAWRCEALIPDVADGRYPLAVRVRDLAGNPQNSTPIEVVVDARSANVTALRLAAAGPDFIELAWLTAQPATSRVLYGTTEPRDAVDDPALTTSHRMRIDGLQPRTNYTVQVVSTTPAGVVATSNVTRFATTSAFELLLPELASAWQGLQRIDVDLRPTTGSGPFQFSLRLVPDDAHLAPFVALARTLPPGPTPLQLDTTVLPDGEYTAIATATRQQDSHRVQERIRIDNVAPIVVPKSPLPGAVTPQPRPWLQVHVNDPGQPNGFTARVRLMADGRPADFEGLELNTTAFPATLVLRPAQPLPEGPHNVTVQVVDEAGNVGEATWPFTVDLSAPDPTRGPVVAEGRPVRPGAEADLVVGLQDMAGVAKAVLEVDNKTKVPLASAGDGTWRGRFRVPGNLSDGVAQLRLRVTDAFGTNDTLTVRLVVDSRAPLVLDAKAESQGQTTALVRAGTNEAAVVTVHFGNRSVASTVGLQHVIVMPGLVPGVPNRLLVNATDLAGNPSTLALFVTPPADDFPPTSVRDLRAASGEEGKVHLQWVAADDNVGLMGYQLTRVVDGLSSVVTLAPGQTSLEDAASPGELVTYSLRAIDVAGNPGPSASVQQAVLSVPHVTNLTVEPATGPADRPFTVRVEFRTASGAAPDRVGVQLGDQRFTLRRANADDDCRTSCAYEADVRLAPTSALDPVQQLVVEAVAGEAAASASTTAPLVTAGSGAGARVGGQGAPGLPVAWILLVLAAWGLLRRRAA